MKDYKLWAFSAIVLLASVSCSNEDTVQNNGGLSNEEIAGMTEFSVEEIAKSSPYRTMGIYSGAGIDFYWTTGDKLWINNTAATPMLIQSSKDNIDRQLAANGDKKTETAKFYFTGTYTESTYPVRYTGNGNPMGNKVTIKAVQNQQTPNDGSHIGADGDCGTAIATKNANDKYTFTLSHKASYLTIYPYYSQGFADDVKVTQIKVTADQPIAGTYDFNDNGIQTSTGTSTSTSITLTLNGGGNNGFAIPNIADYSQNAAIMVIAPGSYTNFTVEYTLHDRATNVTGTVRKNYGAVTCNAGNNKKIEYDLAVTNYRSDLYYMWDANYHYWHGYESSQPALNGGSSNNYPHDSSDQRWHKEGGGTGRFDATTPLFQSIPNVNEMLWYIEKGNPCWDSERVWAFMKHLYKGGTWFKKKSKIATEQNKTTAYMKDKAPDGNDHRVNALPSWVTKSPSTTIPNASELSNYFYLPAVGDYRGAGSLYGGVLTDIGSSADYWSSSAHQSTGNAYGLYIDGTSVIVGWFYRSYGCRVQDFE